MWVMKFFLDLVEGVCSVCIWNVCVNFGSNGFGIGDYCVMWWDFCVVDLGVNCVWFVVSILFVWCCVVLVSDVLFSMWVILFMWFVVFSIMRLDCVLLVIVCLVI